MKTWLLMLSIVLLAGCNSMSTTVDGALEKLDANEDSFTITQIHNTFSMNPKQNFYVFEGETAAGPALFVANVVTNDLYWYAKQFVQIGAPDPTTGFRAGMTQAPGEEKDGRILIPIPNDDNVVWIEWLDK